jgi:hypothetical protein
MFYARARRPRRGQARAAGGAREAPAPGVSGIVGVVGIFPDLSEAPLARFPASSAFFPDSSARGRVSEDAGMAREGFLPGRAERATPCCGS